MKKWLRPVGTVRWVSHQLLWGARSTEDVRSFLRYSGDVILYHVLGVVDLPSAGRQRRIGLKEGVRLTYRLNRGDIQSIREVWVDECYRPPESVRPLVVIDLGANIGMTSVFLATRHGSSVILAVEPDASNCRIADENFRQNGVQGRVICGGVGSVAGTGYFQASPDSNLGRIGGSGIPVPILSMHQLLQMTPDGKADLVKMDIEGGEADVLKGDVSWLSSVRSIVAEFHPTIVDYEALVGVITTAGFTYIPAGTLHRGDVDQFLNVGAVIEAPQSGIAGDDL